MFGSDCDISAWSVVVVALVPSISVIVMTDNMYLRSIDFGIIECLSKLALIGLGRKSCGDTDERALSKPCGAMMIETGSKTVGASEIDCCIHFT